MSIIFTFFYNWDTKVITILYSEQTLGAYLVIRLDGGREINLWINLYLFYLMGQSAKSFFRLIMLSWCAEWAYIMSLYQNYNVLEVFTVGLIVSSFWSVS